MQKLIAYPLTVIYFFLFGLTLVIFHAIQWVCLNVFGYQAHKISVDWLQFFIMRCLNVLGTRFTFKNPYKIETGQAIIIVANHQSMYDIPPLIWYMRKYHPKFISKIELAKGIPSVSYNLRHGGSVLIDRRDAAQALNAIKKMAKYIKDNKRSVVIFPEGSRSRNGQPKPFKTKGLLTLIEYAPNALLVPVTINNSWKLLRYGKFPMGLGTHVKLNVHQPLKISEYTPQEIIEKIEAQIINAINI